MGVRAVVPPWREPSNEPQKKPRINAERSKNLPNVKTKNGKKPRKRGRSINPGNDCPPSRKGIRKQGIKIQAGRKIFQKETLKKKRTQSHQQGRRGRISSGKKDWGCRQKEKCVRQEKKKMVGMLDFNVSSDQRRKIDDQIKC